MESIHGHEVLNMMIESGEQYSNASLEAAITARFGEQARFHTCSAEGMTAAELVAFLEAKGSLLPETTASLRTKVRSAAINILANGSIAPPLANRINSGYQAWPVLCR